MVRTVFKRIECSANNIEFAVKVSMCEIYNEKIKDLQNVKMDNLKILQEKDGKGIYISDITERYCSNEFEVHEAMTKGAENRAVATTKMNDKSSRSHCLFILTVIMVNNTDQSCKTGKLYLVDLAGSERI